MGKLGMGLWFWVSDNEKTGKAACRPEKESES